MGQYRFETLWQVDAPIERVWDAIVDVDAWPAWWKGVVSVERLRPGDADRIGETRRHTWKSRLPYRIVFDIELTRSERPTLLVGRASGELAGTGTWTLRAHDGGTRVRYLWEVRTTRPWMNLPIPFARRIFTYNHDVAMGRGAEGLSRLLGVRVVDLTHADAGAEVSSGGG